MNESKSRFGLDEAESARLRFNSHDDALNHANKLVEDWNRRCAVYALDIAECYKSGHADICINFATRHDAKKFHFVFRPIPDGRWDAKSARDNNLLEVDATRSSGYRANDAVFVGASEFIECPQRVIPSFVWLERGEEVNDFLRHVFADSVYGVLKFRLGVTDREIGVHPLLAGLESVNSLVECGAEVVNGVNGDAIQSDWQGLSELDLIDFLRRVRINLNDSAVWVSFDELGDLPFKISDVMLCPREAVL